MLGYGAIGRRTIAIAPASMITSAITHAKIGRSMKKCDTAWRPSTRCALQRVPAGGAAAPELAVARDALSFGAPAGIACTTVRGGPLQSFDNDSITRLQAGVEQPVAAERARSL